MTQSLTVYINDSVTHLQLDMSIGLQTLSSDVSVNDGAWHSITVSVVALDAYLTVDGVNITRSLGLFAQNIITSPINITLGGSTDLK